MYAVSKAYKDEQAQALREKSYVWVDFGLINKAAQRSAVLVADLADYSKTELPQAQIIDSYYATCEQDFVKADGTMSFLPEDGNYIINQGAVTDDFMQPMTFKFGEKLELGGITIDFGIYYPTKFKVENGTQELMVDNSSHKKIVSLDFYGDYITITPLVMVGGERFRIAAIMFGVSFEFDNSNIISTKRETQTSHLSIELPQKKFTFTVDNSEQLFTLDNPDGYCQYLEEQQVVSFYYGRDLPDGTVYRMPGGVMSLSSWSSNSREATFEAVGNLDYSETVYYMGKRYPDGISLYELAANVLDDAGISLYRIDPYLRNVYTTNPLPIETHKSCLMMIANASQSVMYEDRDGAIVIKSSFTPKRKVEVEEEEAFANVSVLTGEKTAYNYATGENDYVLADGNFYFIPNIEAPQQTGYVSTFDTSKAKIIVTFESAWTFYGLTMIFGSIHPEKVVLSEYFDGNLTNETEIAIDSLEMNIGNTFADLDRLEITFKGVGEGQRIHLNKLQLGSQTDYVVDYMNLAEVPNAVSNNKVRNVAVKYYSFVESPNKQTASVLAVVGENLVTFSEPSYEYSIEYDGDTTGELVINEFGVYYCIFTASIPARVKITATQLTKMENTYLLNVNPKGNDITLENDLISSYSRAGVIAEWFKEYYKSDFEYDLTYRGEPAIDGDDLVYVENKFTGKSLTRVLNETLETSLGVSLNCKMKVRRVDVE